MRFGDEVGEVLFPVGDFAGEPVSGEVGHWVWEGGILFYLDLIEK